jgi:hypothetical protein
VWEKLTQEAPPEAVRMDKEHLKRELSHGVTIVVVPGAPYLTFDPPTVEFQWNGGYEIRDFACDVDADAPLGSTVLEFGVFARAESGETILLERVRLGIGILESAPAAAPLVTTERPLPRTIFASFADEDSSFVDVCLAVAYSLRIDPYHYRLHARPGPPVRATLQHEIGSRDAFLLFWSDHARKSEWVAWEIEVALECEKAGRPEIIPYLMRSMEPDELPPRLVDRQFLNPFLLMSDYTSALEMQRGMVTEPDASPLSAEVTPRVVDTRKHRRPPDEAGPDDTARAS